MGFEIFVIGYNLILCDFKSFLAIQKLTHLQQRKSPNPKHKNQITNITQKITKPKLCSNLDVVYHLRYFYVICYECGDSDGYI
jgi:hypothetical protein